MHVSKLSAKGQVTIPIEIRKSLGIEPGDLVAYELQGQYIKLRRITPFDAAFHSPFLKPLKSGTAPTIKRLSMICNQWDVVAVPFPFTDKPEAKKRPALVQSIQNLTAADIRFLP